MHLQNFDMLYFHIQFSVFLTFSFEKFSLSHVLFRSVLFEEFSFVFLLLISSLVYCGQEYTLCDFNAFTFIKFVA